ncbi:MAG TPA: hypothetical protein VHX17_00625 [Candidatus Cybelea sp.]|nr:hypothetical protein [Candidatus Cybelea sp.]
MTSQPAPGSLSPFLAQPLATLGCPALVAVDTNTGGLSWPVIEVGGYPSGRGSGGFTAVPNSFPT